MYNWYVKETRGRVACWCTCRRDTTAKPGKKGEDEEMGAPVEYEQLPPQVSVMKSEGTGSPSLFGVSSSTLIRVKCQVNVSKVQGFAEPKFAVCRPRPWSSSVGAMMSATRLWSCGC